MSYALYIGRAHSAAGHAWLAGYGDEPSGHWLHVTPSHDHAPNATITVGVTPQAWPAPSGDPVSRKQVSLVNIGIDSDLRPVFPPV